MTGAHGAGKATLTRGLTERLGLSSVDVKVFALGRMLDAAGLETCRGNAGEQNRQVRELAAARRGVVTSRLGLLDVAVYAAAMRRFGRIDAADVAAAIGRLRRDLDDGYALPQALIAMVCDAEALQDRLLGRDRKKGLQASRSVKKLRRLLDVMSAIYRDGDYPDDLVAELVEHYRGRDRLLVLDTTGLDVEATRDAAARFLEERRIAVPD